MAKPLPAHVNEKRPVLIWVWSIAYLLGGDQGLVWTWRFFYLLMIFSLFLLLRRLSSDLVAAMLASIVAVAPVTQGLLSWMACATYLVSYTFLLLGTLILLVFRGRLGTITGLLMLVPALLSREVAFLLIPGALGVFLFQTGRWKMALFMPVLVAVLWISLPGEGRSVLGTLQSDPSLFLRGAFLVGAAELAALVRNLGLVLLCPLVVMLWGGFISAGLILAAFSLFFTPIHFVLPIAISVAAFSRSRESILGLAWMILAILAMCLYGNFSSRYAFEPLIGLTLAIGPAMATFRPRVYARIAPFVLWFVAISLAPDRLYQADFLRKACLVADQRLQALHAVTSIRNSEFQSLGGKASDTWRTREDLKIASREKGSPRGFVWTQGRFWRAGSPPGLRCRRMDHVVFTRENIWEWNVWYWRILPPQKGRGIHVDVPGEAWEVHPGTGTSSHDACLYITVDERPATRAGRLHAIRDWLADTPERNNAGRIREWLNEIWETAGSCQATLSSSAFPELELGRLLIRDDGWLDLLELNYLRHNVRMK